MPENQQFCQICGRGVITNRESMYQCGYCHKTVCGKCFSHERRACVQCTPEQVRKDQERGVKDIERGERRQGKERCLGGGIFIIVPSIILIFLGVPLAAVGVGIGVVLVVHGLIP